MEKLFEGVLGGAAMFLVLMAARWFFTYLNAESKSDGKDRENWSEVTKLLLTNLNATLSKLDATMQALIDRQDESEEITKHSFVEVNARLDQLGGKVDSLANRVDVLSPSNL